MFIINIKLNKFFTMQSIMRMYYAWTLLPRANSPPLLHSYHIKFPWVFVGS